MKYFLLVLSLPLCAAQLSEEENKKVKSIYQRMRRDAVIYEGPTINFKVERPSMDNCVSSNNIDYQRISLSRKYTYTPKKSEYKKDNESSK